MKKFKLFLILVIVVIGAYLVLTYKAQAPEVSVASYEDGIYLGFIHQVDRDKKVIAFDDAVWLTGKDGEDAAILAGHCTEETRVECLPNDYFIKNAKITDENLALGDDVAVFMQTWKMEETGGVQEKEINLDEFVTLINDETLHWRSLPYYVTTRDNKIVRIDEIYIP